MTDDSDLRAHFDRLKSEDIVRSRPFTDCWEEARQKSGRDRWILNTPAISAALALIAIAAFVIHLRSMRQASIEEIAQWRSPTAFLLRTPGNQLFTTIPRFGEPFIPVQGAKKLNET